MQLPWYNAGPRAGRTNDATTTHDAASQRTYASAVVRLCSAHDMAPLYPMCNGTFRHNGRVNARWKRSRWRPGDRDQPGVLVVTRVKPRPLWNRWFPSWLAVLLFPYDGLRRNKA